MTDAIRRVAAISMHTSPLDQPGVGDAGGMNVYLAELSKKLAERDIEVEIFTRATRSDVAPCVELAPGVHVRHVPAGPFEIGNKEDLPEALCTFIGDVLRAEAAREPGYYDVVHSHYWLSGQVGRVARRRWGVPLIHTAHTLALVKNAGLAPGDAPEPGQRIAGEELIVADADALVANTRDEADSLVALYGAEPSKVDVVSPGVNLSIFHPGNQGAVRAAFGWGSDEFIVAFVGRLQAAKGPDIAVRAAARLAADPTLRRRLRLVICGGTSGSGPASKPELLALAHAFGISEQVTFVDALPQPELAKLYQAADVTLVPSRTESFGLVAVESQACGTPVVAAEVGGLRTAVAADVSGVLVAGHDPIAYAEVLHELAARPVYRDQLSVGALRHAARFSWDRSADELIEVFYAARRHRTAARQEEQLLAR